MDGASGGGGDNRGGGGGGSWRGRKYDATNQIKQFLGVPTEDDEKPVLDAGIRSPPQNIPRHRQGQIMNDHDRSGSPSTRHQRWDNYRYQDGRRRSESYGSPGRNQHRQYEQTRTPPHRYQEMRHRHDSYNSPENRMGGYDRGYGNSPRNQHHMRDMPKDLRDFRNGPRHHNSPGGQSGLGPDAEAPDFRPSPEVLAELEEQFLYPLKKKSLKFPKAKYFCRLCDYHCDSLDVCRRHIRDNRHRKLKEAKDVDTSLKNMPLPSEAQIDSIDKLIRSLAEEMRVTPELIQQRQEVVTQLNGLLVSKVEGCHLEMVGSSLSGFCLKTSDINIDVVMDDNLNPSTALLAVKELVGRNSIYKDVVDDLSSSFPTMAFTHTKTGFRMVVGACGASSSKLTNQLLADYASLDPRVLILGIALRYWAQLCQIDNQGRGTLPPHVFPLMVVHFFQQHQPAVLPVLHLLHPNPDGDVYLSPSELGDKWQAGANTQSVGHLWLEMFRFYTVGFKMSEHVINVRQLQPMSKSEKTWSKKIVVEDPFLQKRNLTRTVSGNSVFEYIIDRFKSTYRYFATPQLAFGPLFQHISVKEARTTSESKATSLDQKSKKGEILLESLEKVGHSQSEGSSECEMEKIDDDIDTTVEGEELDEDEDPNSFSRCEPDISTLSVEATEASEDTSSTEPSTNGIAVQEEEIQFCLDKITSPILTVTPSQATKLIQQVQDDHIVLNYRFDGKILRNGLDPPLICGSCQKEGHCKADCREDELPPLKLLPPMRPYFIKQLTAIFEQLKNEFEPTPAEIEERDRIVADLELFIRQFFPGVTLKLFGSSANGFGFQHSDLDICLTFDGNPTGQDIDHIKIIEALAEKLKKYRQCGHVFAITTAKVPIVKFSIRRASLEGDLSLYNTLALQNTKLLATYAKIDKRVKCLGYGMKYFAKLCDIGDASRGSLSSYAYILMVLHFLQQCKPPVIPVLQELYDKSKPAPELMIDGRNAWFFYDLDSLPKVWKDYNKNKDSVGQLWVSMLRYYTEIFNWKENVVTIRQAAPLTRLEKLWNSRCIVIEDPFDLSHNLGAGLSRKMNTFIMKAFIRGREVFGSPVNGIPQGYRNLVDYLFDIKHLTDGAPPNDRGCRFCGKIGHIQKDCPKKKLNMERKEKKERHKDRHEVKKEDSPKPAHNQTPQDNRFSDNAKRRNGTDVVTPVSPPSSSTPSQGIEDVASGKSPAPPSTSTKAAHSQKDNSRMADQVSQGRVLYNKALSSTPSSSPVVNPLYAEANSITDPKLSTQNSKPLVSSTNNYKSSSVVGSRVNTSTCSKSHGSSTSDSVLTNGPTVTNSSTPGTSKETSSICVGGYSGVGDEYLREKSAQINNSRSGGVAVVGKSIPPGFQMMAHSANKNYSNKGPTVKDHIPQSVGNNNQNVTANSKASKTTGQSSSYENVPSSHSTNQHFSLPLEKPQQLSVQQKQQQKQHHLQQQQQKSKYSDSWPSDTIPQPYPVTESQEQPKEKNQPVPTTAAPQNHQSQQQYYYSITPAALFHMASQVAGGQLSAVLMPSATESNNSTCRVSSAQRTTPSHGTTNTTVNAPPPPPPPGFSAPVTINYPSQQLDPYKLVMGSPLYRSPSSQTEGQPVVPSTASQPFINPMGQNVGGMTGVYTLQQNSSGSQFSNMTPTGTAHSPHTITDPNLNQQQVPFETRHYLSQIPQAVHQGVPQGVPQNLTSVPPGIPQGVTQAVPQNLQGAPPAPPPGLSTSVPQGVQGVSQGLHQNLTGGVPPQVSMGSALSPAIQQVPIGHHLPQHYPQPSFPQQGYQMAVTGPSGFYPEFVFGDPSMQNPSPNTQGPPTIPAEMIADIAFQRPDVYDSQMPALPPYLASSIPQHQNIISQISQPHPNMNLAPQHAPPTAAGPAAAYTPASVIFIDGERDGSQIMQ